MLLSHPNPPRTLPCLLPLHLLIMLLHLLKVALGDIPIVGLVPKGSASKCGVLLYQAVGQRGKVFGLDESTSQML